MPDSGPTFYTFVEHRRYLDALLETLGLNARVTLVVHNWGSALGFDWAYRHRDAIRGIADMEAVMASYWRLRSRRAVSVSRNSWISCGH